MFQEVTVLLLEGRSAGSKSLGPALDAEGLTVQLEHTGSSAVEWLEANTADLIIYEASSMRSIGIRTCRRIRSVLPDTPIIHCRSRAQSSTRNVEADIYLVQPFTSRKLLNRIKRLLPADDLKEEIVRAGNLTYYVSKRSVDVAGQGESRLTPKLACLLEQFLIHPNEVVSRLQLMENVWNTDYIGDTRTLDVHVRWMREIIEKDPAAPVLLKTVRGMGYIFAIPEKKK
ncbi:MAG: response regulator transcription factor [Anaerolineae bacterium]|nr:MAG: response regulator transcription factor [Anaerolineae bacterium]